MRVHPGTKCYFATMYSYGDKCLITNKLYSYTLYEGFARSNLEAYYLSRINQTCPKLFMAAKIYLRLNQKLLELNQTSAIDKVHLMSV